MAEKVIRQINKTPIRPMGRMDRSGRPRPSAHRRLMAEIMPFFGHIFYLKFLLVLSLF